jgi:hypothetical protein
MMMNETSDISIISREESSFIAETQSRIANSLPETLQHPHDPCHSGYSQTLSNAFSEYVCRDPFRVPRSVDFDVKHDFAIAVYAALAWRLKEARSACEQVGSAGLESSGHTYHHEIKEYTEESLHRHWRERIKALIERKLFFAVRNSRI